VFTGYIDDSGSKESSLFTFSCLVGWGSQWLWFELAWIKLLEDTNKWLASQGRARLSRYHAADCSSCQNEFKGWTRDEQKEFTSKIITIFCRHPMLVSSYTVNLKELVEEIPETKPHPRRFAYVILLNHLMIEIGDRMTARKEFATNDRIALIHDRCEYDAALLEMFEHVKTDPSFKYGQYFTTIAPMGWEECVPLQPADLLAYENFKEAEREIVTKKRNRRKTLELLLDLGSFGGRGSRLGRPWLKEYKKIVDELGQTTKQFLFPNARKTDRKKGRDLPNPF
jgi:hypothetical protein